MRPLSRHILFQSFKTFDLVVILLCLLASLTYRTVFPAGDLLVRLLNSEIQLKVLFFLAVFAVFWTIIGHFSGLYLSRRLSNGGGESTEVLRATFFAALLVWPLGKLLWIENVTGITPSLFWILAAGVLIPCRLSMRYFLKQVRLRGHNLRHLVVVGSNERAIRFMHALKNNPEWGYHVIGFVDDEVISNKLAGTGYRVVSNLKEFPELLRERIVDEVAVFLPWKSSYEKVARIARLCQEQGIILRLSSEVMELESRQVAPARSTGASILIAQHHLWKGWQLTIKRGLDIVLSFALLILLSPLLLIVALLIKLTSRGRIFFLQERVGINKRRFKMIKFRTMVEGAEASQSKIEDLNEVDGPVFKIKQDPRITSLGKWLRQTSLDELPQLLNVLVGDMSLVGPRPLPLRDYERFYEDRHRRRLSIRPGLTCLWQVRGRSSIPFEEWMELDMEYIDQWSLSLDFRILMETIPAVLKGTGAE